MRGFALWLLGASVAFFVTAGAFLFLANLGAGPPRPGQIPQAPRDAPGAGPELTVSFAGDRLGELERSPGQTVLLYVENTGEEEVPKVDLALAVSPESAVRTRERDYQTSVRNLAPGERRAVELEVDLSPPMPAQSPAVPSGEETEDEREILEARATAPGGRSAVQTAVLP